MQSSVLIGAGVLRVCFGVSGEYVSANAVMALDVGNPSDCNAACDTRAGHLDGESVCFPGGSSVWVCGGGVVSSESCRLVQRTPDAALHAVCVHLVACNF